jgi:hypothetical protein
MRDPMLGASNDTPETWQPLHKEKEDPVEVVTDEDYVKVDPSELPAGPAEDYPDSDGVLY